MKFIKKIRTLIILSVSSLAFGACVSDDSVVDKQPVIEQPVDGGQQVYTVTVNANKSNGSHRSRALALSGSDIDATWTTTENIYVKKDDTWATGSLNPQTNGATAVLKGNISDVTIQKGDNLTLQFPRKEITYAGQIGTLDDIAKNFDYATANAEVTAVTDGQVITKAVTFENKQTIVKFTLQDKDGADLSNTSTLIVNDGTNTYNINPSTPTNEFYVAIPGFSGTLTVTAILNNLDVYKFSKSDVTFNNGKFSDITLKMKKIANEIDLSKLTGDYEAKNGDVLVNTAPNGYNVTIPDGATVTLKDANISIPDGTGKPAIKCAGSATIILLNTSSEKTNTLQGGKIESYSTNTYNYYPGIEIGGKGNTLTIKGTGKLESTGAIYAAGIGGGYVTSEDKAYGNIVIEGGKITARGGDNAAGIGTGYLGGTADVTYSCGNIIISGGTVFAYGGIDAAGIGTGEVIAYAEHVVNNKCGNISISGGEVTAIGNGSGAGIGTGIAKTSGGAGATATNSCGSINISCAFTANKGLNAPYEVGKGGIGSSDTSTSAIQNVNSITINGTNYPEGYNHQ